MKLNNNILSICLTCCFSFALIFIQSSNAEEYKMFEGISCPSPNNGLTLEVWSSNNLIKYGMSTVVFLRFTNTSDNAIYLPMGNNIFYINSKNTLYSNTGELNHLAMGMNIPSVLLKKNESIVVRARDYIFGKGVQNIQLKFTQKANLNTNNHVKTWTGEILSNSISITVVNEPLTEDEKNALIDLLSSEIETCLSSNSRQERGLLIRKLLTLGSFSESVLVDKIKNNSDINSKLFAIEVLGKMANKDMANEYNFERQVNSFTPVLDQAKTEKNPTVKYNLLFILSFYKDKLDESQTSNLKAVLRSGMNEKSNNVRFASALQYLLIFPKEGKKLISKRIDNKSFLKGDPKADEAIFILKNKMKEIK
jgi:hypothetical protein